MKQTYRFHPIVTERLRLREIQETDADLLVGWRTRPEVYRYFVNAHPIRREEHLKWFWETYLPDADRIDWLGCKKENGNPVGVFGVKRVGMDGQTAELSYLLDPREYHKGYAQEVLRALLEWSQNYGNVKTAIAEIHKENEASLRLIEKLGFAKKEKRGSFLLYEKKLEGDKIEEGST